MSKKLIPLLIIAVLLIGVIPATAQDPVTIVWYVGLGTGSNPEHQEPQESVVAAFNETHDNIELQINVVLNDVAYDTLATLIASDQAPDIVGPVGFAGSWAFAGSWLDLDPLVEASGIDMTQFWPEAQIAFNRTEDAGLIGLPFAVFPNYIYFNRDLFDEAGLEYPPQEFGAPYVLDGEELEWNFDTMRQIGMYLTVDSNGNDATSDAFDPEAIEQFGFEFQWMNAMGIGSVFGAGSVTDADGNAVIPSQWGEGFNWWYNAMHTDHFMPNESYRGSDLLAAGNPFSSGRVAMASSHLWYTCCIDADTVPNWDIAVVPAYDGKNTSLLHADTYRIMNTTEHPEEAFEVLMYMLTDASSELLQAYGAFPSNPAAQEPFVDGLNERFPQGVNWQVAIDSLGYPDVPSHEQNMPNWNKAFEAWDSFNTLLTSDPGLDVNAELASLLENLQAIYDEVSE